MDQGEHSNVEKLQIKSVQEDKSRRRSLEFLLLAVGRQISSSYLTINDFENSQKIKDDLKTLCVEEDGDTWVISTKSSSFVASKSLFSFYRRESKSELIGENFNAKNADMVLRELLELPLHSNPKLKQKSISRRAQPELFNLYFSLFCIGLCMFLNFNLFGIGKSVLVPIWSLHALTLLVASFAKKRVVRILIASSLVLSFLLVLVYSLTNPNSSGNFMHANSLLATTILLISSNLVLTLMGKSDVSLSGSSFGDIFSKIVIGSLVAFLIASNLDIILDEFLQIIILGFSIIIIYQTTKISRYLTRFSSLVALTIAGTFIILNFIPDLGLYTVNYTLLIMLMFIAVNTFEFFHGRRLNLLRFFVVNSILIAGVIA